jgi:hypothetical protein
MTRKPYMTARTPGKDYLIALAKIGLPTLAVLVISLIGALGGLAFAAPLATIAGVYWARMRATLPVTLGALVTLVVAISLLWVLTQHPSTPAAGVIFISLALLVPGAIGLLIPQRSR